MQVTPFQIVLWTSAWAAIGWLTGHCLAIGRESRSKRKRYKSYIELLKKETEARFAGAFFLEQKTTFAKFDSEALDVRPYIRAQNKFDSTCKSYREVSFSILDDKKNKESKAEVVAILNELLTFSN